MNRNRLFATASGANTLDCANPTLALPYASCMADIVRDALLLSESGRREQDISDKRSTRPEQKATR